jgi:hypothetical protein
LLIGAGFLVMAALWCLLSRRLGQPAPARLWGLGATLQGMATMACAPIAASRAGESVVWDTVYVGAALGGLVASLLAVREFNKGSDLTRPLAVAWLAAVLMFLALRSALPASDEALMAVLIVLAILSVAIAREFGHIARTVRSPVARGLVALSVFQAVLAIGLIGEVQHGRATVFGDATAEMPVSSLLVILVFRAAMHALFAAVLFSSVTHRTEPLPRRLLAP